MPKEVPKYGVKEEIRFVGIKGLNPDKRIDVMKISRSYYPKIKRGVHNTTSIIVNIKTYEKTGNRKKYSIHIKCNAPTRSFVSDKVHGWDLSIALHKAFKDIENQIKKRLRTNTTKPRNY